MTDMEEMLWDDAECGRIMEELFITHRRRDDKIALRNALVFRRENQQSDEKMGIHIPEPFGESKLIITHITGALASTAQRWTSEISDNAPRVIVEPQVEGDRNITAAMQRDATMQEHLHNGTWHQAGGRKMQRRLAWAQVVEGAGWYFCYELEAGFGLPARKYFELDELGEGENDGVADAPVRKPDGTFAWAERPDLYEARAIEAMKDQARNGRSLFAVEMQSDAKVYAQRDRLGWKIVAIVEYVPAAEYGPKSDMARVAASWRNNSELADKGIILDAGGKIAGGTSHGGEPNTPLDLRRERYLQCRIWTRTEHYVYVTRAQNYEGGKRVWATKHDYGQVPAWPAPFTDTDSAAPEERHMPAMEGAYASVPGYNQVLTLLSQNTTWNAIPRFVIMLPENQGFMTDARTGGPKILSSDSTVGLDPNEMEVISNGGKIEQLTIEGAGDLLNLLAIYQQQLSDALPSEAAKGTGGTSGPAWTTNLLQLAQRVVLAPAVEFHASAIEDMTRFQARLIRKLPVPVYFNAAIGKRGRATPTAMVNLRPDRVSLNLSVHQSANSREEQLVAIQAGMTMLNNPTGPLIDMWEFFEDFKGSDDAHEAVLRAHLQTMMNVLTGTVQLPPGSLLQLVMDLVAGQVPLRLAEELPAVGRALAAQSLAQLGATAGGGGLTRAAGIVEPGVNAPATLEGTGTAPGALPQQTDPGYSQQAQNQGARGVPAL